jgi:hypothetical protein
MKNLWKIPLGQRGVNPLHTQQMNAQARERATGREGGTTGERERERGRRFRTE